MPAQQLPHAPHHYVWTTCPPARPRISILADQRGGCSPAALDGRARSPLTSARQRRNLHPNCRPLKRQASSEIACCTMIVTHSFGLARHSRTPPPLPPMGLISIFSAPSEGGDCLPTPLRIPPSCSRREGGCQGSLVPIRHALTACHRHPTTCAWGPPALLSSMYPKCGRYICGAATYGPCTAIELVPKLQPLAAWKPWPLVRFKRPPARIQVLFARTSAVAS